VRTLLFASLAALGAACTGADPAPEPEPPPSRPSYDDPLPDPGPGAETIAAMAEYPTLVELYQGDRGIYRGCGPNNGVCHNAKEFPNLSTLGSILEHTSLPCNEKRDVPGEMHNLCERHGDLLRIGENTYEIGHVQSLDPQDAASPRNFRVTVKETLAPIAPEDYAYLLRRYEDGSEVGLLYLTDIGVPPVADPDDATGRTLTFGFPPPLANPDEDAYGVYASVFSGAGVVGDPGSLQLGDPNGDGFFGVELGGALIRPGRPELSYLLTRLTDPHSGPLMPRANCCYWTKASLRALWCWTWSLLDDMSNAFDPIDYASCSPLPSAVATIPYPESGEACETSDLCPIQAPDLATDDPTWENVYEHILLPSCGGGDCHVEGRRGGFTLRTEADAWEGVSQRVEPGDPEASELYRRITPELCKKADECDTMPLGRAPLDPRLRDVIRAWIEAGAERR
jgi:hypothetical protein